MLIPVQVGRPDGKPDLLGLKVLDEPAAIQSDPSVLAMQLRHASKQASTFWQCTAFRMYCVTDADVLLVWLVGILQPCCCTRLLCPDL